MVQSKGSVKSRHFLELGAVPNEGQFNLLRTLQITGSTDNPQVLEAGVQLSLNGPRKFALREKRNFKDDVLHYNKGIMKRVSLRLPLFGLIGWNGKARLPRLKTRLLRSDARWSITHLPSEEKIWNYFKAGYEAGKAFLKDGIPRPDVGIKDKEEANFRILRYERGSALTASLSQ